jgi:hypothetical protein
VFGVLLCMKYEYIRQLLWCCGISHIVEITTDKNSTSWNWYYYYYYYADLIILFLHRKLIVYSCKLTL